MASSSSSAAAAAAGSSSSSAKPQGKPKGKASKKRAHAFDNLNLPRATISRVVKSAVPANVQLGREAREAFSKAASIFILYLTDTANQFCRQNKRTILSPVDVLAAVEETEFTDMIEPLEEFLKEFRENSKQKQKRKRKASKAGDKDEAESSKSSEPKKKRAKSGKQEASEDDDDDDDDDDEEEDDE